VGKKESLVVGLDIGDDKNCTVVGGEISEGSINIIGSGAFHQKDYGKGWSSTSKVLSIRSNRRLKKRS